MKKLNFLLMLLIASVFGLTAQAQMMTVTVHVDHPEMATIQQYYFPGGISLAASTLDEQGEVVLEYPDGTNANFLYVYITPVPANGSIFVKNWVLYDADGNEVKRMTTSPSNKKVTAALSVDADGGRLEVEMGEVQNSKVTVNLTGDANKVGFFVDGAQKNLSEGQQVLELNPSTRYIQIKPIGVNKFYKMDRNGSPVNLSSDAGEGAGMTYYYMINSPKNGDVLDIETDYPDIDCNVTFECNEWDFVKTVKVNGAVQDGWYPLVVKAGDMVEVEGDTYNFNVNSCGKNGVEAGYPSYSQSAIIEGDTNFFWNVTRIEREDEYMLYIGNADAQWVVLTEGGNRYYTEPGLQEVGLNVEVDNPIELSPIKWPASATSESYRSWVYINDVLQEQAYNYEFEVQPKDVVKAYVADSEPSRLSVTFTADNVNVLPEVVLDRVNKVDNLNPLQVLPGTLLRITPQTGGRLSSLKVNGEEVDAEWGQYILNITADTAIEMEGEVVEDCNVTLKANIPAGVSIMWAGMYDLEASVEGNVVNLSEYENEWDEPLMISAQAGYTITSMLYNGDEVCGNDEYDMGGEQFMFYTPADGDVYEITLAEIVRDQTLTVYANGLDKAYAHYLTDKYGITPLANINDGYNTVKFAQADLPLSVGFSDFFDSADMGYVYLNDEMIPGVYGMFFDVMECQDGDVLKIFVGEEPQFYSVSYVTNGVDAIITKDHVTSVSGNHQSLPGTLVKVEPVATRGAALTGVRVNGADVAAGEGGAYSFEVNDHSIVELLSGESTGIEGLDADAAKAEIYNLQGIRIEKDVKTLPAGIYIVNGKKMVVK